MLFVHRSHDLIDFLLFFFVFHIRLASVHFLPLAFATLPSSLHLYILHFLFHRRIHGLFILLGSTWPATQFIATLFRTHTICNAPLFRIKPLVLITFFSHSFTRAASSTPARSLCQMRKLNNDSCVEFQLFRLYTRLAARRSRSLSLCEIMCSTE